MMPAPFSAAASAQSSISLERITAGLPIRSRADRRTSMTPPAAAAVDRRGSLTHAKG
jgi:hypothetical protein